jgi:hypothetical protein
MVGGLGDGSHGLHARKSHAALDQARAGEAEAPQQGLMAKSAGTDVSL